MAAERTLYLRRAAGDQREPKHPCRECASLGEIAYPEDMVYCQIARKIPLRVFALRQRIPGSGL